MPPKKDKTIITDDETPEVSPTVEPEPPAVEPQKPNDPPEVVSTSGVSGQRPVFDLTKIKAAELISNFRRFQENDVNLLPEGNEVKVMIGARTIGVLQPPARRNKGVSVRDLLGQMRNSLEFKAMFDRYCDVTQESIFNTAERKAEGETAGLVVTLKDSLKYFIGNDGKVSAI